MVHLGKLTESFYPDSSEVRKFMEEHILHELVVTGDAWNCDHDIIKFNEPGTLWDTDYTLFQSEKEDNLKGDKMMTELCADNIVNAWNGDLGELYHATAMKVQRGKHFVVEISGAENKMPVEPRTGEIPVMSFHHLYVHRCHWCGKRICPETTSLKVIDGTDITILCSECLDWKPEQGKYVIIKLSNNVRYDKRDCGLCKHIDMCGIVRAVQDSTLGWKGFSPFNIAILCKFYKYDDTDLELTNKPPK